MGKSHYVNNRELEDWWRGWGLTKCRYSARRLSEMVYKICEGIARHFNPKSEEEYLDHVHDAFVQTMEKIYSEKLKLNASLKSPGFNLLTTTIFRILYSKMNKQKKYREHCNKIFNDYLLANSPELIGTIESPFEFNQAS